MTQVSVVSGDIARVPADALVTLINAGGAWWGGVDGAIQRAAGPVFHQQALQAMPLYDGDVIHATTDQPHGGAFRSVLFVVDELERDLHLLVEAALVKADELGLSSITLPTMRTGVMAGKYEPSPLDALIELTSAIQLYVARPSRALSDITIVVYDDRDMLNYLTEWREHRFMPDLQL